MKNSVIREIVPLSDKDCFYIADRRKTEFNYPIHTHSAYELNFIENAEGVKRIVGDSVEVIGSYDMVLITGENLEHVWEQYSCKSDNIREITIQFSPTLFSGDLVSKTQFDSIRKMLIDGKNGLSFPMKAIMSVYPLLDTLSADKSGFQSFVDFFTILYKLSISEGIKKLASSSFVKIDHSSDSRRVQKIQDYIDNNYQKDISLNDMAEMIGMSISSFSRFFKLRTGKTLSEYLIDVRLGVASRMLVNTMSGVAEICYDSGFNNLSNFNRVFKKKKGCTPKEFRENYTKTRLLI